MKTLMNHMALVIVLFLMMVNNEPDSQNSYMDSTNGAIEISASDLLDLLPEQLLLSAAQEVQLKQICENHIYLLNHQNEFSTGENLLLISQNDIEESVMQVLNESQKEIFKNFLNLGSTHKSPKYIKKKSFIN